MPASENGPKQGGLLRPGVVQRAHPLANLSKKTIQDKALARCEPAHAAAVHREPLPPPATRAFPYTGRLAAAGGEQEAHAGRPLTFKEPKRFPIGAGYSSRMGSRCGDPRHDEHAMKALLDEVKASRDDLRRECEGWKEQAQRLALAAPIATPPVPAAIPPAPTPSAPTPRPAPVMVEAAGGLTDQGLEISPASLTEAHPALACRDLHQQVGQGDVGAPKRAIGSDRGQGTADCPSVPGEAPFIPR